MIRWFITFGLTVLFLLGTATQSSWAERTSSRARISIQKSKIKTKKKYRKIALPPLRKQKKVNHQPIVEPVEEPFIPSSVSIPPEQAQRVDLQVSSEGRVRLRELPSFKAKFGNRVAALSTSSNMIYFTLEAELQEYVEEIVRRAKTPHLAIVAMEPSTGRVLAVGEKSISLEHAALHTGFPAASLFKVVTSAAALEAGEVGPLSQIRFRGGNYTLNRWNFDPDPKRDRKSMSLSEALGKSCNPVFGRVALQYLNPKILNRYAQDFGFNTPLAADIALPESSAYIPDDPYELSRAAAGFGDVRISPLHAAALMGAVANDGLLVRPYLIDQVKSPKQKVLYQSRVEPLRRVVAEATSHKLMQMMEYTTTIGTTRKEFMVPSKRKMPELRVAAKTGTLSGSDPEGLNHWFIAAAPLQNPKIALAVISVDPLDASGKSSRIGRMILERYLMDR